MLEGDFGGVGVVGDAFDFGVDACVVVDEGVEGEGESVETAVDGAPGCGGEVEAVVELIVNC